MEYYKSSNGRELYVGSSSDDKPIKMTQGASFIELDTGMSYVWNEDAWIVEKSTASSIIVNSDGESVNIADSYYNDTQIFGTLFDKKLFEGKIFAVGFVNNDVAKNGLVSLRIKTGTNYIYLSYGVVVTGLTEYQFYTNQTFTGDGTSITIFPRNQCSSIVPNETIEGNPTWTELGTGSIPRFLGEAGNLNNKIGGTDTSQYILLPPNSDNLIVCQNIAGSVQEKIGIYADFYEIECTLT